LQALPVKKVFPAHHNLNVPETIVSDMKNAFVKLESEGKLHHGSGTHAFGCFSVWL